MAQTSRLPEDQTSIDGGDGEDPDRRRVAGRREYDRRFAGVNLVLSAFWALVGAAVVLFVFFVALDAIDPGENRTVSLVVLALAVLWLGHSWRRLFIGGSGSRSDRERRGF